MSKARIIFHIDMNSFYASVEAAHHPELKGKPLAVAGNPEERKGIIVTSSYEARAKGVKTTMPIWQARKLCPNLIVVRPNMERYRQASSEIFAYLSEVTYLLEPLSIDEAYLDVTHLNEHPLELAKTIQRTILERFKLPCSIGIGPNKFLAKTASDMKKPLGITVLRIREVESKLWPLPVSEMYGVGKKTAEKLNSVDIHTIGDLAGADDYNLRQLLGINGERLKNRANGRDLSEVDPESAHEFQSIGNSRTLKEDTDDEVVIYNLLEKLSELVEARLVRRKVMGQTVQLTIRYADHETVTRSRNIKYYTDSKTDIYTHISDLFNQHWTKKPLRLLGVTVQELLPKEEIQHQLNLFTYEDEIKKSKLNRTINQLTAKFGEKTFKDIGHPRNKASEIEEELLKTSFQKDFLDDYKT